MINNKFPLVFVAPWHPDEAQLVLKTLLCMSLSFAKGAGFVGVGSVVLSSEQPANKIKLNAINEIKRFIFFIFSFLML